MTAALLDVQALSRHYGPAKMPFRAVDAVSFAMRPGTVFGIVGESGCGKSTLARLVMALDRATGGRVLFEGRDLFAQSGRDLKAMRQGFQMVFQDPYGSLDPRQRVGTIVAEPLYLTRASRREKAERVAAALASVGLAPADADRLPHAFSGGQRQRIAIARAIVGRPRLVVADEPVSALDLSVQAQILNLIMDLRETQNLSFLFISHSLAVVETLADDTAVMYRGRFVETGKGTAVLRQPLHPYTRRLVEAEPRLDRAPRRMPTPPASPAPLGLTEATAGCSYLDRCAFAIDRCRQEAPSLRAIAPDHFAACHRAEDIAA
jgi:peptide/nickel transport system ATP-binding protein